MSGSKRKAIEIIALLAKSGPLTAVEIEEKCDQAESTVLSTLAMLRKHKLVQFAGWGKKTAPQGSAPATWEWV